MRALSLSHMGSESNAVAESCEIAACARSLKVKKRDADCSIGHRARYTASRVHFSTLCGVCVIHFPQKLRSSPLIAVSAAAAAAMPQGNISSQHTLRVNIAAWGRVDAEWLHVPLCAVVCVCVCGGRKGDEYLLHICAPSQL